MHTRHHGTDHMSGKSDLEVALRIKAQTEGTQNVDALGESLSKIGERAPASLNAVDQSLDTLEAGLAHVSTEAAQTGSAASGAANKIDSIGDAARAADQKSAPAHRNIRDGVESISKQLSDLQTAVIAYLGVSNFGEMIKSVAETADEYKNLSARIRLVTGDGEAFSSAMSGVTRVALESNSSLSSTAELFTRIYAAGKEMKLGQEQALALTQTINSAIQVSGASAASADAATTQLIQGLQSGVLRGEEFNSMMEQSPRLAKALADGLGVPLGKLRELANAGSLTSQTVITALQSQGRVIEEEYAKLPATIGRAMTNLKSQWTVFIGETDKGSEISSKAAHAIDLLARNLDVLAGAAISSGKAFLAWKAYNIAAEFLSLRTAVSATTTAKIADTAATAANTIATSANTAAQAANNAARSGAASSIGTVASAVGRLSGALSLVKGFGWAFLLTNLPEIGTWIGETTAKLMGHGKALEEAERKQRAYATAARETAAVQAEITQKTKLAQDAALGLNAVSQKMLADFTEARKAGEGVAEALEKVAKAMNLNDSKGINDAAAALDVLAQKGQITAREVSDAWKKALDGKDLKIFEVEAMAAFDSTEQGARRLAQALDGALNEALRRTGRDLGELTDGVGKAARSAINDVDMLSTNIDKLREKGVDVGLALSSSLNKALDAAKTEKAVEEVIKRFEALGKQGSITGDQLRDGLEKARSKLNEVAPGVTSLKEAFEGLGLKSKEQLDAIAEKAKEAYEYIVRDGTSSTELVAKAFKEYAEKAIEANGGVASSALKIEAAMRGVGIETDATTGKVIRLKTAADSVKSPGGAGGGGNGGNGGNGGGTGGNKPGPGGGGSGSPEHPSNELGSGSSLIKNDWGVAAQADRSTNVGVYGDLGTDPRQVALRLGLKGKQIEAFIEYYNANIDAENAAAYSGGINQAAHSTGYDPGVGAFKRIKKQAEEYARRQSSSTMPSSSSSSSGGSTSHSVTITLPDGRRQTINAASAEDASGLSAFLQQLGTAQSTSSLRF